MSSNNSIQSLGEKKRPCTQSSHKIVADEIQQHPLKKKKTKREICDHCKRPTPQACICAALPQQPLTLRKSRVIVLQHPFESKRKNRSLPIVNMCFSPGPSCQHQEQHQTDSSCASASSCIKNDFDFHTIISKRLGNQIDSKILNMINDTNQYFLLFYPSNDAITLREAVEKIKQQETSKNRDDEKESECRHKNGESSTETTSSQFTSEYGINICRKSITLFFLDGTWKFAKEMEKTCTNNNAWPPHTIRVKLSKEDLTHTTSTITNNDIFDSINYNSAENSLFQPKRFDIRTPPSEEHLSTAECIGHVLRIVEENDEVFHMLMKPLDLMVQQWHSHYRHDQNTREENKVNSKSNDKVEIS